MMDIDTPSRFEHKPMQNNQTNACNTNFMFYKRRDTKVTIAAYVKRSSR